MLHRSFFPAGCPVATRIIMQVICDSRSDSRASSLLVHKAIPASHNIHNKHTIAIVENGRPEKTHTKLLTGLPAHAKKGTPPSSAVMLPVQLTYSLVLCGEDRFEPMWRFALLPSRILFSVVVHVDHRSGQVDGASGCSMLLPTFFARFLFSKPSVRVVRPMRSNGARGGKVGMLENCTYVRILKQEG